MSVPQQLNTRRRNQFLHEAVTRRSQAALSLKTTEGWTTFKSRFLELKKDDNRLVLEYPSASGTQMPEVISLQNVGVSFRRGHKKCLFNTIVLKRTEFRSRTGAVTPAIELAEPQDMFELQRRVFYRTPVPEPVDIQVQLWKNTTQTGLAHSGPFRGAMLDLSAGGLSFAIDRKHAPDWEANTPALCSFAANPNEPPIQATAQFRYAESLDDHSLRVGIQFAGLEASPEGRSTLQRILDLTVRLQSA